MSSRLAWVLQRVQKYLGLHEEVRSWEWNTDRQNGGKMEEKNFSVK